MKKLTLSAKIKRLRSRLRDPEWRKYGTLLLTGKLLGLAVLLTAFVFMNPSLFGLGVHAQSADRIGIGPEPQALLIRIQGGAEGDRGWRGRVGGHGLLAFASAGGKK